MLPAVAIPLRTTDVYIGNVRMLTLERDIDWLSRMGACTREAVIAAIDEVLERDGYEATLTEDARLSTSGLMRVIAALVGTKPARSTVATDLGTEGPPAWLVGTGVDARIWCDACVDGSYTVHGSAGAGYRIAVAGDHDDTPRPAKPLTSWTLPVWSRCVICDPVEPYEWDGVEWRLVIEGAGE